jgi:hypothetical protein
MTQLGFATILLGLMVLQRRAGRTDSPTWQRYPSTPAPRSSFSPLRALVEGGTVAVARVAAAGTPEAPSPVSALMSAAMVNLGVYGIVRIDLQLLGRAHAGGA